MLKAIALLIFSMCLMGSMAYADIPEMDLTRPMELNIHIPQLDNVLTYVNRTEKKIDKKLTMYTGLAYMAVGMIGLYQNNTYGALTGGFFIYQATIRFGSVTD